MKSKIQYQVQLAGDLKNTLVDIVFKKVTKNKYFVKIN